MAREVLSHIQPTLFAQTVNETSLNKFALVSSGVVAQSQEISSYLAGMGSVWTYPTFISPDTYGTSKVVPTSDSSVIAPVETITSKSEKFIRQGASKSFSVNSLNAPLIGADPLSAVVSHTSDLMNQWRQASLVNQLDALLVKTGAVVSANYNKIAAESVAAQTASTKIGTGIGVILDTLNGAWSDADPSQSVLIMHSDLYYALAKQNINTGFVPLALQSPLFKNFMGYPVLIDNTIGKRAGTTDGLVYTVYVIRAGGVAFGQSEFAPSFEMKRDQLAGNGAGADIATMREFYAFHVPGTSFAQSITGDLPTDTEVGTAAKYALINDRRTVGIAAFSVNL